jgi:SAM-dependent methyltransferase
MGEIFRRPIPPQPFAFTGERLTTDYGGQTEIEHLHRYMLAREWCRDKDILDVASGEGYGTALLAQVAQNAIGVEISPEAVEHANGAYGRENLEYLQGDARKLPLPDASRDIVISFETIEHFAEQEAFLEEVKRVLRPGGLFVVSSPDRDNYSPADTPANPYHVKELTGAEFEGLLRSKFAYLSMVLQRPVFGSVLLPAAVGEAVPLCFERRGDEYFEASAGLARPQYFIAFASDAPPPALPASVYVDTGRLGMMNPVQADAALRAALAELTPVRQAHADELALRQQFQERCTALTNELGVCGSDLTGARSAIETLSQVHADELALRQQFQERCSTLTAELDVCRSSLASAQSTLEPVRESHANELALRQQFQERCSTLTAELEVCRADLAGARGALEPLRQVHADEHALRRQFQERCSALTAELEVCRVDLAGAQGALEPLRQVHADEHALRQQFQERCSALTADLAGAQSALEALHEVHADELALRQQFQERCSTLTNELEACRAELQAARGEAKGLLAANERTEQACHAFRDEARLARQRTAEAQELVAQRDQACHALRDEVRLVQQRLVEAQELVAQREQDCDALRDEVRLEQQRTAEARELIAQREQDCDALRDEVRLEQQRTAEAQELVTQRENELRDYTQRVKREIEDSHALAALKEGELKDEIRDLAGQLGDLNGRFADLEAVAQQTEARLLNTLASHSWRVTKPVRWLSRLVYHRP